MAGKMPPFLTRVYNLGVATAKHTAAGSPTISQEEALARFNSCRGTDETPRCEFYDGDDNGGWCELCGCPIGGKKAKITWEDTECPDDNWPELKRLK